MKTESVLIVCLSILSLALMAALLLSEKHKSDHRQWAARQGKAEYRVNPDTGKIEWHWLAQEPCYVVVSRGEE